MNLTSLTNFDKQYYNKEINMARSFTVVSTAASGMVYTVPVGKNSKNYI